MTNKLYTLNILGGSNMGNDVKYIGNNIKYLREQSKITQSTLAKFLKVDQSLISKIEKNQRSLTSDLLEKLSSLFGVSTESFFEKNISAIPISVSLRAIDITSDDLEAISSINKIVLNLDFMTKLLRDFNNDR